MKRIANSGIPRYDTFLACIFSVSLFSVSLSWTIVLETSTVKRSKINCTFTSSPILTHPNYTITIIRSMCFIQKMCEMKHQKKNRLKTIGRVVSKMLESVLSHVLHDKMRFQFVCRFGHPRRCIEDQYGPLQQQTTEINILIIAYLSNIVSGLQFLHSYINANHR